LTSSRIDIRYVAKLARIALTDEEVEIFGRQLGDLLGHVNALSELDTESVPATAQVVESRNVTRDDLLQPCLDRERVLAEAPQRQGGFFRVPRIIAE
jgi:aspartyl-tRNA(Asn)/glutamyl-tRNA(Gln) amidotransferase subunit C